MAIAASAEHGFLVPDTVTTVSITPGTAGLFITNRSGDTKYEMWVRLDGQDPAAAGSGSILVTGATRAIPASAVPTSVRLISSYPIPYSVETY